MMPEQGEEMCVICSEAITNPICPDCLQRQVEHWLADVKPTLVSKTKDYAGIFSTYRHESTECIICGDNMNICAHCYCKDIFEFLNEELGEKAEDFLYSFNFELMTEAG